MPSHQYFIDLAQTCAKQSSCLRRHYGCVIINKNGYIVSTGYNGSPRGKDHCTKIGWCLRNELNIPAGSNYEKCCSIHDLQNALIQAGKEAEGCISYLYGYDVTTSHPIIPYPCFLCTKMAINAGLLKAIMKVNNTFVEIDFNELYDKYLKEIILEHDNLV
jgi:dCMP deaminase